MSPREPPALAARPLAGREWDLGQPASTLLPIPPSSPDPRRTPRSFSPPSRTDARGSRGAARRDRGGELVFVGTRRRRRSDPRDLAAPPRGGRGRPGLRSGERPVGTEEP